jgi:hypothetical protein
MKCVSCGKSIKNAHALNGKNYGYSCYRQQLALIRKEWEDANNFEYAMECIAAMEIYKNKRDTPFKISICNQWQAYNKLTAKQLDCVKKSFNAKEKIEYYKILFNLTKDSKNKEDCANWMHDLIRENRLAKNYLNDVLLHEILMTLPYNGYKYGISFIQDVETGNVFIISNGKNSSNLNDYYGDDEFKILKVIYNN